MTDRSGRATDTAWGDLPAIRARVLVKGASSTVWVSPPGGSPTRQPFAWWLEALLNASGLPSEVRNRGAEAQKITEALCDWDTEIQQWSPDVVILNYGQYEAMPGMLPRALERHAVGWHKHPGSIKTRYHKQVVGPSWRFLAGLQQKLDRRLNPGPYRTTPKRIAAELDSFVRRAKMTGSPLILVMDTWPLSTRWREWFPGMETRAERIRVAIADAVWAIDDPTVQLFPLWEIVSRNDLDEVLPDGVHFSAPLHREIAEELTTVILEWAAKQPHLQHPSMGRRTDS